MAFPTITYNITDCCVLQLLRNGDVIAEFYLSELRIEVQNDSFKIFDSLSAFDFSNFTIAFTADELRTERCTCVNG